MRWCEEKTCRQRSICRSELCSGHASAPAPEPAAPEEATADGSKETSSAGGTTGRCQGRGSAEAAVAKMEEARTKTRQEKISLRRKRRKRRLKVEQMRRLRKEMRQ